jgi:hypothetical protein
LLAPYNVNRLVHEARDPNLPVEPGVRPGRDALVLLVLCNAWMRTPRPGS